MMTPTPIYSRASTSHDENQAHYLPLQVKQRISVQTETPEAQKVVSAQKGN